jgi:hypothetical protein
VAAGLSAAKLGDMATANIAVERLRTMRTQAESGSTAYRARQPSRSGKEVVAVVASANSDVAGAEQLLKEATVIALTPTLRRARLEPDRSPSLHGEVAPRTGPLEGRGRVVQARSGEQNTESDRRCVGQLLQRVVGADVRRSRATPQVIQVLKEDCL